MSVRHIHAKPGEYIAVHRNGCIPSYGGGGGGTGGDAIGCLCVVGIILFIFFADAIFKLLMALLTCAAIMACIAGVGWLLWTFRTEIGKGLYVAGAAIWHGTCAICGFLWKQLKGLYHAVGKTLGPKTTAPKPMPASTPGHPAEYGKIIQRRR